MTLASAGTRPSGSARRHPSARPAGALPTPRSLLPSTPSHHQPTPSHHQRAHRVKHPAERVEHQAKDFEGNDAEQRFRVAGLPEAARCVTFALRQREVAFRDGTADGRAVREHEVHLALRHETDGLPHRLGEERVGGPAIDQKADGGYRAARPADGPLHVADTHAPEDGVPSAKRRHRKFATRRESTPVLALRGSGRVQPRMSLGAACRPRTTGVCTRTMARSLTRCDRCRFRRSTQAAWRGPMGLISTTWPSMSSTRSSSWNTPAWPMRWYSSTVKRCAASGIAIL